MAKDALVITGATATGKTDTAIEVALRLGAEVVSMDSRQVYRGMHIGTAKPTLEERRGVPHHGFDLVDPDERYSAGRFAREARGWIADIRSRGRVPILAGGTGFFLRALMQPLFREPPLASDRRSELQAVLSSWPARELERWARALDPGASVMLAGGRQRLMRVIEVAMLTGRPISWWHAHAGDPTPPLRPMVFVLELPRPELRRRIDARVDRMMAAGLVEEVRGLVARGFAAGAPGMNATGYVELLPYLEGERTIEEAIALIQSATRRYARRQATWFRNQLPADAVRLDAGGPLEERAALIARRWEEAS